MQKKKIGIWQKLCRPFVLTERFTTQAEIQVAACRLTAEEIQKLPRFLRRWLYAAGMRFLARRGCAASAPDQACAEAFSLSADGERGLCFGIEPQELPACLLERMRADTAQARVFLKARRLDAVKVALLDVLCPRAQSLELLTDDSRAEELADRICTAYGFYPGIRRYEAVVPPGVWLVDLDAGAVRSPGGRLTDARECALDLHGYRVDQEAFFGQIRFSPETLTRRGWTAKPASASGKNG